jgi:colicin import membrane protein
MKRTLIAIALIAVISPAFAQTASLESRLRDQLRETRTQLQDLQAQQSQWASEKAALEKERDEAKKTADAAHATPARPAGISPEATRAIAEERQRREAAEASLQRGKADRDASGVALRTADAERARLARELDVAHGQVDACTARNIQMYRVGQEVISAYESIDMSDVVSSRQPFAAKSRVKLETAAQSFGDRLYEQRFDPRSGQASTSP